MKTYGTALQKSFSDLTSHSTSQFTRLASGNRSAFRQKTVCSFSEFWSQAYKATQ